MTNYITTIYNHIINFWGAVVSYTTAHPFEFLLYIMTLFTIKKILLFMWSIFKDYRNYKKADQMYSETKYIISQLGYVVGIFGQIGAGKSTGACAITTILEEHICTRLYSRNSYIRTIINNFDFNKLNDYLMEMASLPLETPEKIFKQVESNLEDYIYTKKQVENEMYLMDRIYNNGINEFSYEKLMKEYIENSLSIYRNNYVFCNIKFKSNITGNRAFDLTGEDFKIKERYWKKDYRLRRNSVFFYDESTLDPDKLNLNWQEKSKSDDGTLEHLRLFRHYYKGTSYYITTLQNVGRLNKSERELFNSLIKIESRQELPYLQTLKGMVSWLEKINERHHKFIMKFQSKKKKYILDNAVTRYKKRKKILLHWMDVLNAKNPILYKVRIYNGTKQAENETRDYEAVGLLFRKKDCYGCCDTYEYSYNYDASLETSEKYPEPKLNDDTIENKIILANSSLRIVEKGSKKKREKKESINEENICNVDDETCIEFS